MAFQGYERSSRADAVYPPSPLWGHFYRLCTLAFEREPPRGHAASRHVSGDWPGFDMRVDDVCAFLPLILQFGLAIEDKIDIDTLAERLREETVSHGVAARLPILVPAWARIAL